MTFCNVPIHTMFSTKNDTIKAHVADLKTKLQSFEATLQEQKKQRDKKEAEQLAILDRAQELLQAQEAKLDQMVQEKATLQAEIQELKTQLEKVPKPCPRCGAGVAPTCGMSCASGGYYSD